MIVNTSQTKSVHHSVSVLNMTFKNGNVKKKTLTKKYNETADKLLLFFDNN